MCYHSQRRSIPVNGTRAAFKKTNTPGTQDSFDLGRHAKANGSNAKAFWAL